MTLLVHFYSESCSFACADVALVIVESRTFGGRARWTFVSVGVARARDARLSSWFHGSLLLLMSGGGDGGARHRRAPEGGLGPPSGQRLLPNHNRPAWVHEGFLSVESVCRKIEPKVLR
eukprot:3953739-Pyramimonas_sp.AAC.2